MNILLINKNINIIKKGIVSFFLLIMLVSCSTIDFLNNEQSNVNKTIVKNQVIRCPKTIIPNKTAYIKQNKYNEQYYLKIIKVSLICRNITDEFKESNILSLEFNSRLELKSNLKVNELKSKFPHLYIAILNEKNENILTKVLSKIKFVDKEKPKFLISKNKLKIKYKENLDNMNIYIGLQKSMDK